MKIVNVLNKFDLEQAAEADLAVVANRREALQSLTKFAGKVALASIPLAMMTMPKARAKGTNDIITDTLNFALTLEFLESTFYNMGLSASGLIPSSDMAIFAQISKHENEHVNFLKSALGSSAVSSPTFDFTAKGAFPDVFTNYQTFLALSQGFEDTGVRAYKGQAGNLVSSPATLTAALQIHSVEARHASEVRRLRGQKGWIVGGDAASNGMPASTNGVYAGEDNTTQGGVDVTTISSSSAASIMEAFDEPLSKNDVLAIADLFIVK